MYGLNVVTVDQSLDSVSVSLLKEFIVLSESYETRLFRQLKVSDNILLFN